MCSASTLVCMFQLEWYSMTDYLFFCLHVDSSLYANYVFNVFDNDRDGKVSFEVNVSLRLTYPNDQHLHTSKYNYY